MMPELLDAAREYPVVTVFGPRQSGKTTLVRAAFPDKPYRSLEEPDVRLAAQQDPRGFLAGYPEGAVLDEIQRIATVAEITSRTPATTLLASVKPCSEPDIAPPRDLLGHHAACQRGAMFPNRRRPDHCVHQ